MRGPHSIICAMALLAMASEAAAQSTPRPDRLRIDLDAGVQLSSTAFDTARQASSASDCTASSTGLNPFAASQRRRAAMRGSRFSGSS
jgi:hypothetical protein